MFAITRVPLAPGPKGGQSSPRRRRPATCEACCARGWTTACAGASDWWLHLKQVCGQRQASERRWPGQEMDFVGACAAAPA